MEKNSGQILNFFKAAPSKMKEKTKASLLTFKLNSQKPK